MADVTRHSGGQGRPLPAGGIPCCGGGDRNFRRNNFPSHTCSLHFREAASSESTLDSWEDFTQKRPVQWQVLVTRFSEKVVEEAMEASRRSRERSVTASSCAESMEKSALPCTSNNLRDTFRLFVFAIFWTRRYSSKTSPETSRRTPSDPKKKHGRKHGFHIFLHPSSLPPQGPADLLSKNLSFEHRRSRTVYWPKPGCTKTGPFPRPIEPAARLPTATHRKISLTSFLRRHGRWDSHGDTGSRM